MTRWTRSVIISKWVDSLIVFEFTRNFSDCASSSSHFLQILNTFVKNFRDIAPCDIALLKLAKPLKLTTAVKAINLPQSLIVKNKRVTLTGWASTLKAVAPALSDRLQVAELPIVDYQTCKQAIDSLTGSSPIDSRTICTGPLTDSLSACSVSNRTHFSQFLSISVELKVRSWPNLKPFYYTDIRENLCERIFDFWLNSIFKWRCLLLDCRRILSII